MSDEQNKATSPTYPPYPYYPIEEEDELSLIDLWNIVWKRKWPWLTLGPLFGIVGIFYALSLDDLYKAEATLAPNTEEQSGGGLAALAGQFGGLASMAGINVGGGGSTDTALAVLKSRQFLDPFLSDPSRLKILFYKDWDETSKTWTGTNPRRGLDNQPTLQEAYERFKKDALKINEDSKTGIVTVGIELTDPEATAIWTNELISMLNAHLREQARREAQDSLDFLNAQLSETPVLEIRQALYTLIENQTKNAMLAAAKEEFAFKVIDSAVIPELKNGPKRSLIVIAAGLMGGVFGMFLCFLLHLKDANRKKT